MPRSIRTAAGLVTQLPRPFETSPCTRVVREYQGNKYLVFVDESMREFFGLNAPNGYLCYAAVGIPEKEYEVLSRALRPIFKEYESAMVGDSQTNLTEFKFEDFRKMDKEQRVRIAQRQIGRAHV